ncbi:DUF4867 family protein [Lactobacillus sp. UCMA15818]|nr:DUF4867 family protein [Lactobacillus sp. UCMA15818]
MLLKLQQRNPEYQIKKIDQNGFNDYGNLLQEYDLTDIKKFFGKKICCAKNGNFYNPSNNYLENMETIEKIGYDIYAGMNFTAGECTGQTQSFSAVEYHQGSEINIMLTDVVMVLGKRNQIINGFFNAAKDATLFFIPAGTVIEMYGDTLHYSPIKVHQEGFKAVVMVLQGTNQALPNNFCSENTWIVKKNKFQAAHAIRKDKIAKGVIVGVSGELIKLKQI